MKKTNSRLTNLLLLLLGIVALAACKTDEKSSSALSIAYLPITHALPLFEAAEQTDSTSGETSVAPVRFSSWTELSDALNTGNVDGAVVLAPIAIKARELGVPIKAIALGHRDGNVVVVSNDIESGADLKGKTVAIPHRLSAHNYLLELTLKKYGLKVDDVQITELPPPEMPAALSEGRIAAYIVAEPFGAKGVVQGVGKVLFTSPELWENSVCCLLVLRDDVISTKPEAVKAFIEKYAQAANRLSTDSTETQRVAQKYLKVDKETLQKSLEWIKFDNLAIHQDDYDVLSHWLKESGQSKTPPAFAEFADTLLYK